MGPFHGCQTQYWIWVWTLRRSWFEGCNWVHCCTKSRKSLTEEWVHTCFVSREQKVPMLLPALSDRQGIRAEDSDNIIKPSFARREIIKLNGPEIFCQQTTFSSKNRHSDFQGCLHWRADSVYDGVLAQVIPYIWVRIKELTRHLLVVYKKQGSYNIHSKYSICPYFGKECSHFAALKWYVCAKLIYNAYHNRYRQQVPSKFIPAMSVVVSGGYHNPKSRLIFWTHWKRWLRWLVVQGKIRVMIPWRVQSSLRSYSW